MNAVDAVIHSLQAVGRLPPDYSLGMPKCTVPANPKSLIGREEEVDLVVAGLQKHRCVIMSGEPGEGKTALAQKVVRDLWERGDLPGGAYTVDLAGGTVTLLCQLCRGCTGWPRCELAGSPKSFLWLHRGV